MTKKGFSTTGYRALSLKSRWLQKILNREKCLEIRSMPTRRRGEVALVTGSMCFGTATIVNSQWFTYAQLTTMQGLHQIPEAPLFHFCALQLRLALLAFAWCFELCLRTVFARTSWSHFSRASRGPTDGFWTLQPKRTFQSRSAAAEERHLDSIYLNLISFNVQQRRLIWWAAAWGKLGEVGPSRLEEGSWCSYVVAPHSEP